MRDKIKTYIEFLFAGAPQTKDTADIKEEILQNTYAYYDDLTDAGKTPEEAYTSAISHIGDVSEILASKDNKPDEAGASAESVKREKSNMLSRVMLAVAILLYICCVIPVIIIQNSLGVCLMFAIAGVATALIILRPSDTRYDDERNENRYERHADRVKYHDAHDELKSRCTALVFTLTLAAYLIVSFLTSAWYITWIAFPMAAAISGIVRAVIDLTRGDNNK